MRDLVHMLLDVLLAKYNSNDISDLVTTYQGITESKGNEEAWSRFTDHFELGNWIYEQAILAEVNLYEFLIDTQTVRSLQEQQAEEERAEHEQEYRSVVGGASV